VFIPYNHRLKIFELLKVLKGNGKRETEERETEMHWEDCGLSVTH